MEDLQVREGPGLQHVSSPKVEVGIEDGYGLLKPGNGVRRCRGVGCGGEEMAIEWNLRVAYHPAFIPFKNLMGPH